ncbi:hypothetical protein SBA4_770017 [Candidatus Sulfopaludibacter sp. SbA4]|nr:hypothetical protein SBA4_770017 [Candidatus Sulfopaludibacter sp. SbA4]
MCGAHAAQQVSSRQDCVFVDEASRHFHAASRAIARPLSLRLYHRRIDLESRRRANPPLQKNTVTPPGTIFSSTLSLILKPLTPPRLRLSSLPPLTCMLDSNQEGICGPRGVGSSGRNRERRDLHFRRILWEPTQTADFPAVPGAPRVRRGKTLRGSPHGAAKTAHS